MFRGFIQSPAIRRAVANHRTDLRTRRALSDIPASASKPPPSPLAGDAGHKATHLHHHVVKLLAVSAPLYLFALPEAYADSILDQSVGLLVATAVAGHSWIGMNYVATDYVPKISKALVGPARIFNAALGMIIFVGMAKIAVNGEGGVKGTVRGLWRPKIAAEKKEEV